MRTRFLGSAVYLFKAIAPLLVGSAVVQSCGGGSETGSTALPRSVESVAVVPGSASLVPGDTVRLMATASDGSGGPISGKSFAWSSSAQGVATVSASGTVTAFAPGTTTITATVDGKSGAAAITVRTVTVIPVGSVTLDYPTATMARGQSLTLKPTLRDSTGGVVTNRVITWTSADTSIVRVAATGVVTAAGSGSAKVTATVDGASATSTVTVIAFASITAGPSVSCALTSDGRAFCAGSLYGPMATRVATTVRFSALSIDGEPPLGFWQACGLSSDGVAYCWGSNVAGQLGVGDQNERTVPTPVAGNLHFSSISVGRYHVCGISVDGAAYCWGDNSSSVGGFNSNGALGVGDTVNRSVPTRVPSTSTFSRIEAGWGTTCAIAASGAAYCWGRNDLGQVGSGGGGQLGDYVSDPILVAGGASYSRIVTKGPRSCGLANGRAYCWGNNTVLELGTTQQTDICYGGKPCSRLPVAVETSDVFSTLATSQFATCALTPAKPAQCWGLDFQELFGPLTGSIPSCGLGAGCTGRPVASQAGLVTLSGSVANFCGMMADGVAYCWGGNDSGQRGWPGTTPDPTPRPFSIAPATSP